MEYYRYFRLNGAPFQPASPKGAVYYSPTHLQGITTLEAGLTGELTGLTMLSGEAGTGKTTLIYALLQRDYKRVRIAHVADPKLSFLEMMRVVMPQLNLYTAGETKLDYLRTLDHLLDLHGKDERIAIIVDEAQVVSDDVLEELRLLSNRGQQNDRCLQLILVGQPELAERLKKPELRQLNQRISSRGVLTPLHPREALNYVECLLSAQGGQSTAIFEPGALDRLLRLSGGIPRKINMLCHSAMMAAFYAGDRKVTVRTAKKVAAEYQKSVGIVRPRSRLKLAGLAAAAIAAVLSIGYLYRSIRPEGMVRRALTLSDASGALSQVSVRAAKPKLTVPRPTLAKPQAAAGDPHAQSREVMPPMQANSQASAASSGISNQGIGKLSETHAVAPNPAQITVKDGDTLEKIAIRYFGSSAGINDIIAMNPHLTDANQLTVGQTIYLPAVLNGSGVVSRKDFSRSRSADVSTDE